METKQKKTADKKAYMREYMKARYNADKVSARAYKNSIKYKKKYSLSNEDLKEYGKYLADIHKLRKLKEKLPYDLLLQVVNEPFIEPLDTFVELIIEPDIEPDMEPNIVPNIDPI